MNAFVSIPEPPAEPFRSAEWVRANVFSNMVSKRWVLDNCPRIVLSRYKVVYLESAVRAWAASRMESAA